jgi:hypothetical protein
MKVEELFTKDIKPETRRKKPSICLHCSEILATKKRNSKPAKFENEVFTNFCMDKHSQGIHEVYKLENMLIDGAIELSNGKLVLVEVKYALNWHNCCNARVEIQRFMEERLYDSLPVNKVPERALIVFHHFSRDWEEKAENRKHKNGWNFFYEEEKALRRNPSIMPIDIVQLTKEGMDNPLFKT